MTELSKKSIFLRIFRSPLTLLFCVIFAAFVGLRMPKLAKFFGSFSLLYTNMLQITVIPIIAISLLTNLANLIVRGNSSKYTKKILMVFCASLVLTASIATISASFFSPGKDLVSKNENIAKIVKEGNSVRDIDIDIEEHLEKRTNLSFAEFIIKIVPQNIFDSLSGANMLQIIVFCIILGIASGFASKNDGVTRLDDLGNYLKVMYSINAKVLFFLPVGIFCLISNQLSNVSDEALGVIIGLAILVLGVFVGLTLISSIILWLCSSHSYLTTVKALIETILMAFSTQSSIVCVPRAIDAMVNKLNFNKNIVDLTIPLNIPLCQYSTICFYAIGSVFVINIFSESIDIYRFFFIIFATVITSMASSGTKGLAYYTLISSILEPMGLPLGTTITLFVALDPLIDPFGTVFHVYAACASSAVCVKLYEREEKKLKLKEKKEIKIIKV